MTGIEVAIGAAWSAIGSMTIGSLAIGGIIQGAIVGAAIGGLTSAITGGDIGKGMLFGAVGGAVIGGFTGPFGMGGGAAEAAQTSTNLAQGTATPAILDAASGGASGTSSGILGGVLGEGAKKGLSSTLVEGVFQIGGGMLQGMDESEEAEKNFERQVALTKMNQEHAKEMAKLQGGASAGALAQVAESRRQFDLNRGDMLEAQKRRRSGTIAAAKEGDAAFGVPEQTAVAVNDLPPGVGLDENAVGINSKQNKEATV